MPKVAQEGSSNPCMPDSSSRAPPLLPTPSPPEGKHRGETWTPPPLKGQPGQRGASIISTSCRDSRPFQVYATDRSGLFLPSWACFNYHLQGAKPGDKCKRPASGNGSYQASFQCKWRPHYGPCNNTHQPPSGMNSHPKTGHPLCPQVLGLGSTCKWLVYRLQRHRSALHPKLPLTAHKTHVTQTPRIPPSHL